MRCKMIIEYDGTHFFGWQRQPGFRTVQGEIVDALSFYAKQEVLINGSGRTDRGVHARGQVASFDWPGPIPVDRLKLVLNKRMPPDIYIRQVVQADRPDFHARFDAVGKVYTYRFIQTDQPIPLFRHMAAFVPANCSVALMKEAAQHMTGTHDFKAFMASGSHVTDTVRTVYDIQFRQRDEHIDVRFFGNGFLYNMVRIMSGLLIDVGIGKKQPDEVAAIIEAGDRTLAERTAPPGGLSMTEVFYSQDELTRKLKEDWHVK